MNGVNSIGTLLVAALLSAHGISPDRVRFVTDPDGFPAMPGTLQRGAWGAAFLAEPYITAAGQQYGQQVLADLDQGAVLNLPVDGYVATQAWARAHPRTAAAFTRAIEQGQAIANSDVSTVQAIMARDDKLPPEVTASMALPRYPVGPVVEAEIQRVARAMGQSGLLGGQDATEAGQRTLVGSMTAPLPDRASPSDDHRDWGAAAGRPGPPAENNVAAIGLGMYQDRATTLRTMRGAR